MRAQFCHGMDTPHQWYTRCHDHAEGAADLSRTVRSATGIDDQRSKCLERQPTIGQVKSIVSGVPLAVISCRWPNPPLTRVDLVRTLSWTIKPAAYCCFPRSMTPREFLSAIAKLARRRKGACGLSEEHPTRG